MPEETDVRENEEEKETDDTDKGGDEAPAWAKALTESVGKITTRLDALESDENDGEEEAGDEEGEKKETKDESWRPKTWQELRQTVREDVRKELLAEIDNREKSKEDKLKNVESYYNNQLKQVEAMGKDVSPEVQREVFKIMQEKKTTSFIEGYYFWEQQKAGAGNPEDKNKKKEQARRIASSGGETTRAKGRAYRPGRSISDVISDLVMEEQQGEE